MDMSDKQTPESSEKHKCDEFCEQCGDCLYCYGEDNCAFGGNHSLAFPEEASQSSAEVERLRAFVQKVADDRFASAYSACIAARKILANLKNEGATEL